MLDIELQSLCMHPFGMRIFIMCLCLLEVCSIFLKSMSVYFCTCVWVAMENRKGQRTTLRAGVTASCEVQDVRC